MNSIRALGVLCVLLLVQKAAATQFVVGGSAGWTVPSNNNAAFNEWAEKMRFQIGDSLLFVYPSSSDSLLQVTKDDYTNCNTDSPLEKHTDGHTVFTFSQSGPYYFISGNKDNCLKNEKLTVVVLADRSKKTPSPAPAPSSSSPAPTTGETPASSPPSSPPAPSTEDTPASSPPESTSSPPNDAASISKGFAGSVGALAAILMAL